MGTLQLIAAHNRQFVFFYYTKACTPTVNFIVFLLGDGAVAPRFSVQLQLSGGSEASNERIEFVTTCRTDDADTHALIDAEECMVLSHRAVRKYIDADGCLQFRVQIRDREAKVVAPVVSRTAVDVPVPDEQQDKAAKAAAPPKVVKKGAIVANLTKKSSAVGGSGPPSSGRLTALRSRVPALGSDMPKIVPPAAVQQQQPQQHQHHQTHQFNQPSAEQHLTNPATRSPLGGGSGSCIGSGGPFRY